jgi:peptide/nickel transport system substrate-binding protein
MESMSQPGPADRSRRQFLRDGALAGGVLIGGPSLLAACGGGGSGAPVTSSGGTPTAGGTPKRGGALKVGISGGSAKDTLDAHVILSNIDNARLYNLYEWLTIRDQDYKIKRVLATDFIPNSKADEYTVKLRPDVKFHNGKTLSAEDVIFSFKRILDPKTGAGGKALLSAFIDPNGMKAVDPLTVHFKLLRPFTAFEDFVGKQLIAIVPVGYDPKNPVGTGPFKYQSFTPGQRSLFVRNDDYWGEGPYVDSVEIINFNEDSARVNALVSGEVHAIDTVPASLLRTVQGNPNLNLLVSETGAWRPITMRVDRAPFDDVRVRQAFRLIVDRKQMVEQAYAGQARVANDLYAIDDTELYAKDLPQREQDIEQAKSLLKKAGRENLSVELVTGAVQAGVVESCVVFAQQAKAAGVNVKVTKLDGTTFYNDQYLQRTFSVDWWNGNSYLCQVAYGDGPNPSYNECHWSNPAYNKLYYQALAELDVNKRREIAHKMQEMTWNEGGLIIFGFPNNLDGYSKKITGFVPDKTGQQLTSFGFKRVWFV